MADWISYFVPTHLRPSPTFAAKAEAKSAQDAKLPINMLTIGELAQNPTDEDFAGWRKQFDDAFESTPKDAKGEPIDKRFALIKNEHAYTPNQGSDGFRATAAWRYSTDTGIPATMDDAIGGAGSKAVLRGIFSVFQPGDKIIMAAPAWPTNYDMPQAGVQIIEVDTQGRGLISPEQLDKILQEHPDAKGILINSPCNPTGQKYSADERDKVMGVLKGHIEKLGIAGKFKDDPEVPNRNPGFLVVEDNPYGKLVFDGSDQKALDNEKALFASGNLVATRTLSKEYGMAGDAVGYAITKNPVVFKQINMWNDNNRTAPTAHSMNLGQLALLYGDKFIERTVDALKKNAKIVTDALKDFAGIQLNEPQATLYAFPDFRSLKGYTVPADKMLDKQQMTIETPAQLRKFLNEVCHACTVPGEAFFAPNSPLKNDCWFVRVGIAGDEKKLQATMDKIREEVGQLIRPKKGIMDLVGRDEPQRAAEKPKGPPGRGSDEQ